MKIIREGQWAMCNLNPFEKWACFPAPQSPQIELSVLNDQSTNTAAIQLLNSTARLKSWL